MAWLNWTQGQTIIPLYTKGIPSNLYLETPKTEVNPSKEYITDVRVPTLTAYFPKHADPHHPAVLICPGGGYAFVSVRNEGEAIAKKFNAIGVTAFMLKYRLPKKNLVAHKEEVPLQDAQRAIQLIRERAGEFHIDPHKVLVIGFSAGGHLASLLATRWANPLIPTTQNISLRPDFVVLGYPVISFDPSIAHIGSRDSLLGTSPDQALVENFSTDRLVDSNTPPTFLFHAADDKTVVAENSIRFFQQMIQKGNKAEIHIYQSGGHGFGLYNPTTKDMWFDRMMAWLMVNGVLDDSTPRRPFGEAHPVKRY